MTESQLAIRRNPQKQNCKLLGRQYPKACNLKARLAWKIDSRSTAWPILHGRLVTVVEPGGRVYDSIEQEAARWPADLVVIGTHGRRGFRRLLLGSVAEGFIRITTKPVLLVRGSER
jgi:hypothetical protein